MIDTSAEHIFPLAKTKDHLANRPSLATVYRWAFKGVRGVKLETIMIGGRRFTSREAVAHFVARLSEPACAPKPTPTTLRAGQIDRAAKRAAETF